MDVRKSAILNYNGHIKWGQAPGKKTKDSITTDDTAKVFSRSYKFNRDEVVWPNNLTGNSKDGC